MLLANFDRKGHVQHRAVSLRQHGFLVDIYVGIYVAMHIYVIVNIYVFLYVTYRPMSVPYGLDELAVASETRNEINIAGARLAAVEAYN